MRSTEQGRSFCFKVWALCTFSLVLDIALRELEGFRLMETRQAALHNLLIATYYVALTIDIATWVSFKQKSFQAQILRIVKVEGTILYFRSFAYTLKAWNRPAIPRGCQRIEWTCVSRQCHHS